MKVSQTPGAGVRARHSATLPLDGPPDDTTIRWWAEIVRGTSDTARGIRTTRSSASESPEGPEEKITIEIRTEPGEDDEGAAWIRYENNSVTLGGEGLDEDIALQWMKRLSARLLHPEERECAQEAPQETSAEPIETYLAEGIPPEGCTHAPCPADRTDEGHARRCARRSKVERRRRGGAPPAHARTQDPGRQHCHRSRAKRGRMDPIHRGADSGRGPGKAQAEHDESAEPNR